MLLQIESSLKLAQMQKYIHAIQILIYGSLSVAGIEVQTSGVTFADVGGNDNVLMVSSFSFPKCLLWNEK